MRSTLPVGINVDKFSDTKMMYRLLSSRRPHRPTSGHSIFQEPFFPLSSAFCFCIRLYFARVKFTECDSLSLFLTFCLVFARTRAPLMFIVYPVARARNYMHKTFMNTMRSIARALNNLWWTCWPKHNMFENQFQHKSFRFHARARLVPLVHTLTTIWRPAIVLNAKWKEKL